MTQSRSEFGVAIVGAGERGVYFVGSRIAEAALDSGLRIVGVHDRLEDRAEQAARHLTSVYEKTGLRTSGAGFSIRWKRLTSDQAVDLVIVTTHTDNHRVPRGSGRGKRQASLSRQADLGDAGRCRSHRPRGT